MATNDGSGSKRTEAQSARPQAPAGGDNKATPPAESRRAGETLPQATAAYLGPKQSLPQVFGRYRVQKKLGGGGMGTVYLVENTELEREEALKVPHFDEGNDPQVRERFLREAKSAAKLDHANLCPVYEAGVQDGIYYLTMRLLKGKLFSDYTGKAQPARKAVEIVAKLAQALEAAHGKGVIHRDLKPSNVMMVAGVGPVVMDFGLAKQVRQPDQKLTQAGATLGTPAYMPPEQVNGDLERMGPASDVYSLGVILYELLTGRLPFEGTMAAIYGQILYAEPPLPSALAPGLDPALDGICRKAMAKAPADRYPSMKAFAAALMDFLRSTPATAGAGNLAPVTGDKADIFQIATVAPGPKPGGKADIFQTPTVAPGPRAANTSRPPRRVEATTVATERSRPAAKPSKTPRLAAGAGVAEGSTLAVLCSTLTCVGLIAFILGLVASYKYTYEGGRENEDIAILIWVLCGAASLTAAILFLVWLHKVRSRPSAKRSKTPWLVAGAGVLAALLAIIMLCVVAWWNAAEERRRFSEENLAKLEVGMTLMEMEEILGPGRIANRDSFPYQDQPGDPYIRTWHKAINEGKVWEWHGRGRCPTVLAAFSGNPSSDSKADVILDNDYRRSPKEFEQKPPDKWHVTKDNFLKLRVGMTLQELEDIIGVGDPAGSLEFSMKSEGWETAIKEYRVYRWGGRSELSLPPCPNIPVILAGFPAPPSGDPAATKVEALRYRDGRWDEDKGALSGAEPLQPLDPTPPPPTAGEDKGALSGTEPLQPVQPVQPVQPANHVSKDNFLKLKVGMTLQELEDIIGVGQPAAPDDHVYFPTGVDGSGPAVEDPAWQKAVKEYRVYKFEGVTGRKKIRAVYVYAGFSDPPSAAPDAKVEALSYRDGVWDEDKGTLSGAEK